MHNRLLWLSLVALSTACRPDWRVVVGPKGGFRVLMPGEPSEHVAGSGEDGFSPFHAYVAIPFSAPTAAEPASSWRRNLGILWGAAQSRLLNRHATYLIRFANVTVREQEAEDHLRRYRENVLRPAEADGPNAWTCRRTPVQEAALELDGHPGLGLVFDEECRGQKEDDPVVFRYWTQFYSVDGTLFALEVMRAPDAEDEGETDEAQRFFESFELL